MRPVAILLMMAVVAFPLSEVLASSPSPAAPPQIRLRQEGHHSGGDRGAGARSQVTVWQPPWRPSTSPRRTVNTVLQRALVFSTEDLKDAVTLWCDNETKAEGEYGHISTWNTGGVTTMTWLFSSYYYYSQPYAPLCSSFSTFNENISAWDGKCGRASASFVTHHQLTYL